MFPASGTGRFSKYSSKIIRFTRKGCTNRPFFHIVVTEKRRRQQDAVIEQLGTYDPLPNQHGEKLVSLNLERISYWMGHGSNVSKPVSQLLGLSGFLPIHPISYMTAWRNRELTEKQELERLETERKAAEKETEKEIKEETQA
ncbi:small ribosomal subunit protein bS16m [Onthophagus taurus]|uniref:small ribosomal subunit protein bS16m n=1 Tax=Onthophagus taurus TaxID=166361 RepID=UPI0039BE6B6C